MLSKELFFRNTFMVDYTCDLFNVFLIQQRLVLETRE